MFNFYIVYASWSPDTSVEILISEAGTSYETFAVLTEVIILKRC
jgi:hypothetical protein